MTFPIEVNFDWRDLPRKVVKSTVSNHQGFHAIDANKKLLINWLYHVDTNLTIAELMQWATHRFGRQPVRSMTRAGCQQGAESMANQDRTLAEFDDLSGVRTVQAGCMLSSLVPT